MQLIRVVVIDSIAQHRCMISVLLQPADDIEVVALARSAHEGIQATESARPQVILTDVDFSDMDCVQLIETLSKQQPRPRIVVISVDSDVERLRGALFAGAKQLLPYPPLATKLLQAVRAADN